MKRMKFDRSFQLPGEGDLRKKTYGGERGGGGGGGGGGCCEVWIL